jgi:hypothetical protein
MWVDLENVIHPKFFNFSFKCLFGGEFSHLVDKRNGGMNDTKDCFLETMGHTMRKNILKSPY